MEDYRKMVIGIRKSIGSSSPELAVIVPTFNERDNIAPLIESLEQTLDDIHWELIFVDDDSPDGTAEYIRSFGSTHPHVRCLQRLGRRGLSSACIEGLLASSAPYLAVMDADQQHDESVLPTMLSDLKSKNVDIIIGSRFIDGGSVGEWTRERVAISEFGKRLSQLVTRASISDPMSGFFMLRRDTFHEVVHRLSGRGFKILLDLFASSERPMSFSEVPYHFRMRSFGESKLDASVIFDYGVLLIDKMVHRVLPVRFVMYVLVGLFGAVIHLAVLGSLIQMVGFSFSAAQAAAVVSAMTFNFFANNVFTYRDRRLRGWRLLNGIVTYYAICAVGGFANYAVAVFIYDKNAPWFWAGLAGSIIGAVWNFTVSGMITWRSQRRAR